LRTLFRLVLGPLLGALPLVLLGRLLRGREALLEGVDRLGELLLLGQLPRLTDLAQDVGLLAAEVLEELGLEAADVAGGEVVDEAAGAGEDGDDLLLDRQRRALGLLEELGEPVAAV